MNKPRLCLPFRARELITLLSASTAITLSACGGGGSTTSPSDATAPPGLTYPAGSPQLAIYELLNQERLRCGFGSLTQNSALNTAATAHATYFSQAKTNPSDEAEIVNSAEFTGATAQDRANAAGYVGTVSETEGYFSKQPIDALRGNLAMPYRGAKLLSGARDVGLGYTSHAAFFVSGTIGALVVDLGVSTGQPSQDPAGVLTYPCEGTTGTPVVAGETRPQPIDGSQPTWGQPVFVRASSGHILAIASATLTEVPTGAAVPIQKILTQATDTNGIYPANSATVIPAALKTSTTYSAVITGTDNGVYFSKTFSFTTG